MYASSPPSQLLTTVPSGSPSKRKKARRVWELIGCVSTVREMVEVEVVVGDSDVFETSTLRRYNSRTVRRRVTSFCTVLELYLVYSQSKFCLIRLSFRRSRDFLQWGRDREGFSSTVAIEDGAKRKTRSSECQLQDAISREPFDVER